MTEALVNAAGLGVGLWAVSADAVQSLNAIFLAKSGVQRPHRTAGAGGGGSRKGAGGSPAGKEVVVFEILSPPYDLGDPRYITLHNGHLDGHPQPPHPLHCPIHPLLFHPSMDTTWRYLYVPSSLA